MIQGEVIVRTTYNVFVKGVLSQIVAEHNRRSVCTLIEVDGKVIKQWDGLTLAKFAEQPYTFYISEQKFLLQWIVQPDDEDTEGCFEIQANGVSLSKLDYLNLDFKLEDEDVPIFDGIVVINQSEVASGKFEWRAATLKHKIVQEIDDRQANDIDISNFNHPVAITNEVFSILSTLNKPDTGFETLTFGKIDLEEKMSPTVVDLFVSHCQQLSELYCE